MERGLSGAWWSSVCLFWDPFSVCPLPAIFFFGPSCPSFPPFLGFAALFLHLTDATHSLHSSAHLFPFLSFSSSALRIADVDESLCMLLNHIAHVKHNQPNRSCPCKQNHILASTLSSRFSKVMTEKKVQQEEGYFNLFPS
jgi:hypothetical protein